MTLKRILIAAASLLLLGAASQSLPSARAAEPQDTEQFLTAVITDVDGYWTKTFRDAGLPEPRVGYSWLPEGDTAAYSPGEDTIYISREFAAGYGRTVGDFAVAFIVAHEYGHQIQDELGLFERYGGQVPTMAFELQADCYAGAWAKSAEDRLEDGDVQEAIETALAVGDFDTGNPGHHGTPEQRAQAWTSGFESGDPGSCDRYLT